MNLYSWPQLLVNKQLFNVLIQPPMLLHNLRASVWLYMLLCVWMCLFWPVALVCSPVSISVCCTDSLPPTGYGSTKLQSMGQHWSAPVRSIPPTGQLGLPRQQLQLHPGWPWRWGGTYCTGNKPPTSPQWAWDVFHRETLRQRLWRLFSICTFSHFVTIM